MRATTGMKRRFFLLPADRIGSILSVLVVLMLFAGLSPALGQRTGVPFNQQGNTDGRNNNQGDAFDNNITNPTDRPPIDLYKIISVKRDTTSLDTTLTLAKDYKFNYLRKDDFELLPCANVGQTYNSLGYDLTKVSLAPEFGARARHFNYMEIEDTYYYSVPTPLTELYFKTVFQQGQQLDAFFTINTQPNLNFSIAYKGLRSLGNYQSTLTSTGNFRFTTNYTSPNGRYRGRAHMVTQDLLNNENGGIRDDFIPIFTSGDPEFDDRGRVEVNFEDAENILVGKRFHLDQDYALIKPDSTQTNTLRVGSIVSFEDKYFEYFQEAPFDGFGPAYESTNLQDRSTLEEFYAEGNLQYKNPVIGDMRFYAGYTNFNYGYERVIFLDNQTIPNRLKGDFISVGGSYAKRYKGFDLEGRIGVNVSGDFDANYLEGSAGYAINDNNKVRIRAAITSRAPNYNFLLHQSDYISYNWQNDFENVKQQQFQFLLTSDKLFDAEVTYTGIEDYAYFDGVTVTSTDGSESYTTPQPFQFGGRVDYLKVKVSRELRWRKFGLNNTIMYQTLLDGESVFKVPELVTRNSLFYEDEWFEKALFVQTGVTLKYFTSYEMNRYDPVLGEFYLQNEQEFGGFPLIDLFFNVKVRQTRVYFKYEHFNSLFSSNPNYFADPQNPYRDAVIRFGLVWNFLL